MIKGYSFSARAVDSNSGFPALTIPPKICRYKDRTGVILLEKEMDH